MEEKPEKKELEELTDKEWALKRAREVELSPWRLDREQAYKLYGLERDEGEGGGLYTSGMWSR